MERFLKFKEDVTSKTVSENLSDDRIIVLRKSLTTGTIQIQVLQKMSDKEIKNAFEPLIVTKVYNEFPYPLKRGKFFGLPKISLKNLFP